MTSSFFYSLPQPNVGLAARRGSPDTGTARGQILVVPSTGQLKRFIETRTGRE
jgi:hypothetical protein